MLRMVKSNTRGNPAMTLGCFLYPNFNGRYGMLGNGLGTMVG